MTVAGLAARIAMARASKRLFSGLLFGVKPNDPVTFVAMTLLLSIVALLASWLPARRATRVDRMVALR